MTLYSCECGNTMEIGKATIVYRDGKWVTKEAKCSCGKWMDSEPTEGMPSLKRTEPSLSMKRDKLWEGATEKIRSKTK
jgi:hypothetical protein